MSELATEIAPFWMCLKCGFRGFVLGTHNDRCGYEPVDVNAEVRSLRTRTEKMERALREIEEKARDFATCEEPEPEYCGEPHDAWADLAAIAREALEKGE